MKNGNGSVDVSLLENVKSFKRVSGLKKNVYFQPEGCVCVAVCVSGKEFGSRTSQSAPTNQLTTQQTKGKASPNQLEIYFPI